VKSKTAPDLQLPKKLAKAHSMEGELGGLRVKTGFIAE
jgi:hypothetical protein